MAVAVVRKPSFAFVAASWTALLAGSLAFLIGLWRSSMQLNEKGFYFTVLMYGLFSAVSVQKAVRDRMDGVPVTGLYYGLSWFSVLVTSLPLLLGLWTASMEPTENGFYSIAHLQRLFSAIAVQKNVRDGLDTPAAVLAERSYDSSVQR